MPAFQAPEICSLYALNVSPAYIRHAIRQRFERNRSVTDPKILDILIAKERMEYQETMNCWKMNDQFLGTFIQTDGGKPVEGTFLQKFYQGQLSFVCFRSPTAVERNADRCASFREGRAGGPTSSYRNVVLSTTNQLEFPTFSASSPSQRTRVKFQNVSRTDASFSAFSFRCRRLHPHVISTTGTHSRKESVAAVEWEEAQTLRN